MMCSTPWSRLMDKRPTLFTPVLLGPVCLRNRVIMAPMATGFASRDGHMTDRLVDYLTARATGGCGLVFVESVAVAAEGRTSPRNLRLDSDEYTAGLARLTESLDRAGAKAAIQLWHAGARAAPELASPPVSPDSATPGAIDRIVESFAQAARRASHAGFHVVEVHAAHGYLLHQFLSPLLNRRTDRYGGSVRDRMRLLSEVIAAVRSAVPQSVAVACRMAAADLLPGGLLAEDGVEIARHLEQASVDAIDVSVGTRSLPAEEREARRIAPGYALAFAAAIKRAVRLPVIVAGRLHEPGHAESALRERAADGIMLGRGLLADPRWAAKVESQDWAAVTLCRYSCQASCYGRVHKALPIRCRVNPALGRRSEVNQCRS